MFYDDRQESQHWTATERIGPGTSIRSRDVIWIYVCAVRRRADPPLLAELRQRVAAWWRVRFSSGRIATVPPSEEPEEA